MKKSLFIVGLAAACAFALTGCVKETMPCTNEAELSESTPYELEVSFPATKTSIDEEFKVAWEEGDQINVFHALAGSDKFINDGAFTVKEAGLKGSFAGKIQGVLYPEKEYDWYIVYPYSEDFESPAKGAILVTNPERTKAAGNSVLAELPLYGTIKSLKGNVAPKISVHQLMAAMKVTFTNIDTDASVKYVRFQDQVNGYNQPKLSEQMVGSFYIDITAEQPVFTAGPDGGKQYNHSTANITDGGTLEVGQSVTTYLITKPRTIPAGQTVAFAANNFNSMKVATLKEDLNLKAGSIQEFNINLGTEWIPEAEAADGILFRFCMKQANDDTTYGDRLNLSAYGGEWYDGNGNNTIGTSKRRAARYFSVRDHFSYYNDVNERMNGSAWISTGRWQDAPECGNNGGRYFLPGLSFDPANGEDYYLINAKLAALKAGTKAVFKTSFMVNADATPKNWIISYSVDGGKSFLPAEVAALSSIDETHGDVVAFGYVNDRACHPVTITCPITANAEKADFQIKIQPVANTFTTKGMFSFAPYYELASADAPLRVYTAKSIGSYGNTTPVCDYVVTMTGTKKNDTQYTINEAGNIKDLSACATLVIK